MQKLATIVMVILLLLVLAACAGSNKPTLVKCPACGYEFEANPEAE